MTQKMILGVCLSSLLLVPRLTAQSAPASSEATVLPAFDISDSKPVGYGTTNAIGATRMNIAIKDTPNSIVILNRELMDDLGTLDGLDVRLSMNALVSASVGAKTRNGRPTAPSSSACPISG